MEVSGWVGPGPTRIFFVGKSSQNSPKPVLIFWSSIPCVFCLYTLLKIVCYYDLSVLSMSVMVSKKQIWMGMIQVFLLILGIVLTLQSP